MVKKEKILLHQQDKGLSKCVMCFKTACTVVVEYNKDLLRTKVQNTSKKQKVSQGLMNICVTASTCQSKCYQIDKTSHPPQRKWVFCCESPALIHKQVSTINRGSYWTPSCCSLTGGVLQCRTNLIATSLFIYYNSQRFPITVNVHVKEVVLLNVTKIK